MPRSKTTGVAIPTAMFIVLLLFGLVTAIQLLTTQNLRVTRYGFAKTQAAFQARAAVEKILFALDNPTLLKAGEVTDAAGTSVAGTELQTRIKGATESNPLNVKLNGLDGTIRVWTQVSTDPDTPNLRLLIGEARVLEQTQRAHSALTEQPASDGILWARIGGEGNRSEQASTYYYKRRDTWTALPPVPNFYRNFPGAPTNAAKPKPSPNPPKFIYARKVESPAADDNGNLYVVLRRGSGQADTVAHFDLGTNQWTFDDIPGIPKKAYKVQSGVANLVDVGGQPRIKDLASDGGNTLFARWGRSDNPDTLLKLDLTRPVADRSWQAVPPTPKFVYNSKGEGVAKNGYVGTLKDLAADAEGNLYARWPRDGVDTVYVLPAGSDGPEDWATIPPPPKMHYKLVKEGSEKVPVLVTDETGVAKNFKSLTVDRANGLLYGVFNRDGVDTIYQYDLQTSAWKVMPPAPRVFFQKDGDVSGNEAALQANVKKAVVDSEGVMFFRWKRSGADALFGFNTRSKRFSELLQENPEVVPGGFDLINPPPDDYYSKHDPLTTPNLIDPNSKNEIPNNVVDLTAGGKAQPGVTVFEHGPVY